MVMVILPCWYFVSNDEELRRKNIKPISSVYLRNIHSLDTPSEGRRGVVVRFVWLGDMGRRVGCVTEFEVWRPFAGAD